VRRASVASICVTSAFARARDDFVLHTEEAALDRHRPPGSAMPSSRAAMLTPSPVRSPSASSTVAEMDADAELDALVRRDARVALGHAAELGDEPVAGALDDAAVDDDRRIDQVAAQRAQARQRPVLVGPGQAVEADNVGGENRCIFRVRLMASLGRRSD
jgi:hypothetical protein